jgi:hypothetical protein
MKLHYAFLLFLIILFDDSQGQKIIDSIRDSKSGHIRVRSELNANDQLVRESEYDSQDRLETVSFYEGNRRIQSFYLDTTGVVTAIWTDPAKEERMYARNRLISIIFSLVIILLLFYIGFRTIGYNKAYYALGVTTIFYPVIVGMGLLVIEHRFGIEFSDYVLLAFGSTFIVLPLLLIAFSVNNIVKEKPIKLWISKAFLVIAILLLVYITFLIMFSGPVMLG